MVLEPLELMEHFLFSMLGNPRLMALENMKEGIDECGKLLCSKTKLVVVEIFRYPDASGTDDHSGQVHRQRSAGCKW
jgi:hypothetical protein